MQVEKKTNPTPFSVRSSQMFYTFADDDMAEIFIELIKEEDEIKQQDHEQQKQEPIQMEAETEVYEILRDKEADELKKEQMIGEQRQKGSHVSRLQIEIQKNKLELVPVYGEIFIKLIESQLMAQHQNSRGLILLTNYRLAFFKLSKKKIDLPFGYIDSIKITQKSQQFLVSLKHGHSWKFKILKEAALKEVNVFLTIYLKSENPRSNFAFAYGQKCPTEHLSKESGVDSDFKRMGVENNDNFEKVENSGFQICQTYPQFLYLPAGLSKKIGKMAKLWNFNRFPILSYVYKSHFSEGASIWRSSHMCADRNQQFAQVGKYFEGIRKGTKIVHVFDCSQKSLKKNLQQPEIYPHCKVKNLELQPLSTIKNSYLIAIECFLAQKKGFIKNLLTSKWYDAILNILKGTSSVVNCALMGQNCIIKCMDGRQRSAQISALTQIILQPEYRTFQGFAILIQKQFQHFGYPFSSRLGMKSDKDETIPMFIQFLDCVSQLINSNPLSFEFNYKFLSKLSNLMYTCLFGNFLGECQKQRKQNKVDTETASIWGELSTQLTQNPYYQQKQGLLTIPQTYNQIRVWKEHFWYLTTPPKQTYKINPLAEDNHDYKSLACLQIKRDNDALREQVTKQRKKIQSLRAQIEAKKNKEKS